MRGGARKAGPGKTMGAPKKPAQERTVSRGPYRFPPDVVEILGRQRNATAFICEAVRHIETDPPGVDLLEVRTVDEVELEVAIINCRCGADYISINDYGTCPNGCPEQLYSTRLIKIPVEKLLKRCK